MVIGVVLTCAGCAVAVAFGPNEVLEATIPQLVGFWTATPWIVYLSFVICLAVAAQLTYNRYSALIASGKRPWAHTKVLPVAFSMSSALVGTQSVVQAKCLAELLPILFDGSNIFIHWYTWMVIILFVTQLAVWLSRLTEALNYFDPLFIIPLLQVRAHVCQPRRRMWT